MGRRGGCGRGLGAMRILALVVFLYGMAAHAALASEGSWWGDLSFLYLGEEVSRERLFVDIANGDKLYSDETLSWAPGWRVEFGYTFPTGRGVSLAYMGRVASAEASLASDFFGGTIVSTFQDFADPLTVLGAFDLSALDIIELETAFHSWEANFHMPIWVDGSRFGISGRLGPRVIWIRDRFSITGVDEIPRTPFNVARLQVDMDNLLIGAQVGLGAWWRVCPWFSLSGDVNVGAYYGHLGQDASFVDSELITAWSSRDTKDLAGLFGELRLAGEFRIIERLLSARLGYMLLWISDTGRSINQVGPRSFLPASSVPSSDLGVHADYTLYHGGLLSLVVRF